MERRGKKREEDRKSDGREGEKKRKEEKNNDHLTYKREKER